MHRAKPLPPMTSEQKTSVLFKSALISIVIAAAFLAVTVPAMMNENATAGVVPCVIVQMIMTTVCVGGWFAAFLAFDPHLGDESEHH